MADMLYSSCRRQDRRPGGWTTTRTSERSRPRPTNTSRRGWSGSATSVTWLASPGRGSTSPSRTRGDPSRLPPVRGPIRAFFLGTTRQATWEEVTSRVGERGFVWLWVDADAAIELHLRRGDVVELVRGGVR